MLFSAAFKIGKKKITFTFSSIENLEAFCKKVQEEYPDQMFYLYNRTTPTPSPQGYQPKGSKMWCPYCGSERKFVKWPLNKKYKICEICNISDSDWNVRKENKLWESIVFTEDGDIQVRKGGKSRKIGSKKRRSSK